MDQKTLDIMMAMAESETEAEKTVQYLYDHFRTFLKRGETVMICFSNARKGGLGWLMEQAVLRCGAAPLIWGPDYRWKTVLQQAFYNRATVIMAPPLIVLGLSKLKKYTGLPIYIRHVVTAGYPCLDWMIEGIANGLDCSCRGVFTFGETGIVAGISCDHSAGVHIRKDAYDVHIVDPQGNCLPAGNMGEMIITPKGMPELRLAMGENARIVEDSCPCGMESSRLMDMRPGSNVDADIFELSQKLLSWTSILDCILKRGPYGMEVELVVFGGEKLPKLPSAAKQVIRSWNPSEDTPYFYMPTLKKPDFSAESH